MQSTNQKPILSERMQWVLRSQFSHGQRGMKRMAAQIRHILAKKEKGKK